MSSHLRRLERLEAGQKPRPCSCAGTFRVIALDGSVDGPATCPDCGRPLLTFRIVPARQPDDQRRRIGA